MSLMPNFSMGTILPSGVPSGPSLMPNIMPMLGPYRSASSSPTFRPSWPMATARLAATVLLPTPPLPEATTRQCLTVGSRFLNSGSGVRSHSSWTSTRSTPGHLPHRFGPRPADDRLPVPVGVQQVQLHGDRRLGHVDAPHRLQGHQRGLGPRAPGNC